MFDFKRRTPDKRSLQLQTSEKINQIQGLLLGEPLEASRQAKIALAITPLPPETNYKGRLHLVLGKAAIQNFELEEAKVSLEQALQDLPEDSRDAIEANLYYGRVQRDLGNTTVAIEILQYTIKEAQAWGLLDIAADAMNSLSSLYYNQGTYGAALITLNTAAELAQRLGQPNQEAKFLSNIANILTQLGDYPQALEHLLKAQQLLGHQGSQTPTLLLSIGNLYQHMEDINQAISYYHEALKISIEKQDQKAQAVVYNNLGNALLSKKNHHEAFFMFNQALELAQKLTHIGFEIDNLDGLGQCYRLRGQHQMALEMHSKALSLAHQTNDQEGVMDATQNLGEDHLAIGNPTQAINLFQETLSMAQAAQRLQTVYETHLSLAQVYETQGQLERSLSHQKQYFEVWKSVFQQDNEKQKNTLQAQFTLERQRLEQRLEHKAWREMQQQIATRTSELELAQKELVTAFATAVEYREDPNGEHSFRVAEYAARIAIAMGWSDHQAENLRLAAQLHDLGKLGISSEIRLKPTELTSDERQAVQQHPTIAEQVLLGVRSEFMLLVNEIATMHHERFDGTGYPHGLVGNSIAISARIVAVADAYDVITRGRVYQPANGINEVLLELKSQSGKQFDPDVVKAALEVLR